jgi:hypothetical protein
MSSIFARCLYGFSQAPIGATISVVSEVGVPDIATTLVREKDGFLNLAAYNFTFSSPTVRVKLTQEVVAPTPSPSASPTVKPVVAKKITITCVKGKTSKKVTAVKPLCPKGFKKK